MTVIEIILIVIPDNIMPAIDSRRDRQLESRGIK